MGIAIAALADHAGMVPAVAHWCYHEWCHLSPNTSLKEYTQALREWIQNKPKPTMFVALDDLTPVGCIALTADDPATSMKLGPWLGALYVTPHYRARSVGLRLVHHLIGQAQAAGVYRLYACVTDKRLGDLARRAGWRNVGQEFYKDRWVTVISLDLKG